MKQAIKNLKQWIYCVIHPRATARWIANMQAALKERAERIDRLELLVLWYETGEEHENA